MKKLFVIMVLCCSMGLVACGSSDLEEDKVKTSDEEIQDEGEESEIDELKAEIEELKKEIDESKEDSSNETGESKVDDSAEKEEVSNIDKNFVYGIEFLGYSQDYDNFSIESYLTQEQISTMETFEYEGDEYYLILPTQDDIYMDVYAYDATAADGMGVIGEILYTTTPGDALFLRCNVSDIHPNVSIWIGNEDDKNASIQPGVDMSSDSMAPVLGEGAYRIGALWEDKVGDEAFIGDIDPYQVILENIGEAALEGRALMMYDPSEVNGELCQIIALGTDSEEKFTAEQFYAVSDSGIMYTYDVIEDIWY